MKHTQCFDLSIDAISQHIKKKADEKFLVAVFIHSIIDNRLIKVTHFILRCKYHASLALGRALPSPLRIVCVSTSLTALPAVSLSTSSYAALIMSSPFSASHRIGHASPPLINDLTFNHVLWTAAITEPSSTEFFASVLDRVFATPDASSVRSARVL